jgi:hypothetical protein
MIWAASSRSLRFRSATVITSLRLVMTNYVGMRVILPMNSTVPDNRSRITKT